MIKDKCLLRFDLHSTEEEFSIFLNEIILPDNMLKLFVYNVIKWQIIDYNNISPTKRDKNTKTE